MEKSISKFLEFNGQAIYFLAKDGVYWIALRPICEAIGIDFDSQLKIITTDPILAPAMSMQPVPFGTRIKKTECLPEFFVYGWIFSIQAKRDKGLHDYQWKCYELLYNHFHGTVGNRKDLLREDARLQVEKEKLLRDLETNPEWLQLVDLDKRSKKIRSELKTLDKGFYNEQLDLFSLGLKS